MPDLGQTKTEKELKQIERKLAKVYREAAKDMQKKIADYTKQHERIDAHKRDLLSKGKITEAEYKAWQRGQVFITKQWQSKADQIARSLVKVDENAERIVHEGQLNTFADNANFFEYRIDKDLGFGGNFSLYDSKTVAMLVKDSPELLRRRYVDGKKAAAWNVKKMANAITQGIIQGESIPQIALRIARDTASSDMKAMLRYARTAMTGAQNAGRIQAMQDSINQGIAVKKVWIATLDDRTRDAHADLDGQVQDVDKPFSSELGPIMFPGDPNAADANIWNCRCALGYEYPDSKSIGERYDQEAREDIADMTYVEWEKAKEAGAKTDYSNAKKHLFELEKKVIALDADHVFSGIWKNDVTYADYPDKEAAIPAKRAYFQDQIDRAVALSNTANEEKFRKLMDELDKFEQNGLAASALLKDREDAKQKVKDIASQFSAKSARQLAKEQKNSAQVQATQSAVFSADAYTQARKDKALWAKSGREADNALRDRTGEVWRAATDAERDAIFEYTQSYHKFNEPLRGIEYGSNVYKGVGNTDLNAGYQDNGDRLNALTDILAKCSYDIDVWLQRGCGYGGMDKFFQTDMYTLRYGTQQELEQALLGKTVTDYGFVSCGSSKGVGFTSNPILLNVYAPKGTHMMYVEPFSAFGRGDGYSWDGLSKQHSFGGELETLLQQGTQFRVTKVERSRSGTIYVDLDIIAQDTIQRYVK